MFAFKNTSDFASRAVDFGNFKVDFAFTSLSAFGVFAIALTIDCFSLECVSISVATSNTTTFRIEEDVTTVGWDFVFACYDNPDWAKSFDVVVHNECFADTTDTNYIRKIVSAHQAGVSAVVIHCAMHTYRATGPDLWREFLGVTSRRHDHQSRYEVKKIEPAHPIVQGIPDGWKTPMDELYVIEKLWPNAKALATSVSEQDGTTYPVIWINQYGKARVFGTTYGHSDDTFRDPVFLDYLSRGVLWAAGRLEK